jgi:hypothetical protein
VFFLIAREFFQGLFNIGVKPEWVSSIVVVVVDKNIPASVDRTSQIELTFWRLRLLTGRFRHSFRKTEFGCASHILNGTAVKFRRLRISCCRRFCRSGRRVVGVWTVLRPMNAASLGCWGNFKSSSTNFQIVNNVVWKIEKKNSVTNVY